MFERLNLLIKEEQIIEIEKKRILLVGIGGVGGACLEALVRLGFQHITIIDNDSFTLSNLNRQILSTINNIGHLKVKEAEIRAKSINPNIYIHKKEIFVSEENIEELEIATYDYIIDCCDTLTTKVLLVEKALEYQIKIISSMGTGNRLDPTKLETTDIWKTKGDPLAKRMRSLLRKKNIANKIPVVTSKEIPIRQEGRVVGSCALVPNTAGFFLASYVFNDIIFPRK